MNLSPESAERITLLFHAAKRNGSLVSVQELSRLLREAATESDVEEAIASIPSLSSRFELRSGYLTERNGERGVDSVLLEADNRRTARTNLSHASRFSSFLRSSKFELVAVSGSTSYGSASLSRDADLFCVAQTNKMWTSLTWGLIMARAYRLTNRGAPDFCLSYVMDEDYARSTFKAQRHPLFARDALEAKVLLGQDLYESLMGEADWISQYYPVAYAETVGLSSPSSKKKSRAATDVVLNKLLCFVVGRYLRLKSYILNRKLAARGRESDLFDVRFGEDRLIYESRRYKTMRREYAVLSTRTQIQN